MKKLDKTNNATNVKTKSFELMTVLINASLVGENKFFIKSKDSYWIFPKTIFDN